jgi:hypothetical protein
MTKIKEGKDGSFREPGFPHTLYIVIVLRFEKNPAGCEKNPGRPSLPESFCVS